MIARRPLYFMRHNSALGEFGLIWRDTLSGPVIRRIFLPGNVPDAACLPEEKPCDEMIRIGRLIGRFLKGEAVVFDLSRLDMEPCSVFQKRVLLAESQIPRGRVSTYGRLASAAGNPSGARAVGRALATNPYPMIIPCHRTVKGGGFLGGFQGGLPMKQAFLEMEGISFTDHGRVRADHFFDFGNLFLRNGSRAEGGMNTRPNS